MRNELRQGRGVVIPYLILLSIFISTAVPKIEDELFPNMHIWHIMIALIVLANTKKVAGVFARNQHLVLFLVFVVLHALLNMFFVEGELEVFAIIRRVALMLTSYSVLALMLSYYYRAVDIRPSLDRFLAVAIISVSVFGLYELFARKYGLPLGELAQQHFRSSARGYMMTDFFSSQMTGIFKEPRFFSFFLVVCLYILLFLRRVKHHFLLVTLVLIDVLLSMSITGYLGTTFVLLLYFVKERGKLRFSQNQRRKQAIVGMVVTFLVIAIGYSSNVYQKVEDRLVGPFVQNLWENLQKIVESPVSHTKGINIPGYSAYISTFGEMSFIIKTLRDHPLMGYGIGYSKEELDRTMGLNAFTEVMVRWGCVGLLLFIFIAIVEQSRYPYTKASVFFLFYLLFCSSDGSVAEIMFWFLFAMVLLYQRLNYRFEYQRIASVIDQPLEFRIASVQ